jgi:hypothetical protein
LLATVVGLSAGDSSVHVGVLPAALAGGHYVIKYKVLSKRSRKQLSSYVSLSAFKLKLVLNDTMAPG